MPKARDTGRTRPDTIDNPLRRRLLAGGTAALLTGAAIATTARSAPGAACDDAELLRLCRALVAQALAIDAISNEPEYDQPDIITPQSIDHEERLAAADSVWFRLTEKITDIPARTPEGVQAKAGAMLNVLDRVVLINIGSTLDDVATGDEGEIEDRMALSLARDVLAGRAAA
jgi:hypothetical protein